MNINHISVSRKSVWDLCEEQYRFKYHEMVVPTGPEPPYFAYGKLVHKIAEEYVSRGDPAIFSEIVRDVLDGTIEIEPGKKAPKLDAEYTAKLGDHLKTLKEFALNIGLDRPGYTEYKFEYDLRPPDHLLVTGFIDRIVIKDDTYFIVDYKTTKKGKWRKNSKTILDDIQLRLYANVVHRDFGVPPEKINCCLYYLDGGNLVGATYTKKSMEDAERDLLQAYLQIQAKDPNTARGNVGDHCSRCDFRDRCRFYQFY